jgi:hypothetical protein
MTRQQQLNAYLDEVRTRRFKPGAHDCGMFAAGWVYLITGTDHGAPYRGKYRNMQSGQGLMEDAGFADHVDYVASILAEVSPALAQTGDLAVIDGHALGIVASDRVFVLRPDGLGHVSRLLADRAFTV